MKDRPHSFALYQKMKQVIPGGVNSPVRRCQVLDKGPIIVESGKGDLIFDADGNSYIDFCGSWGALLHGHAHPVLLEAVIKRAEKGTSFGISSEIEFLLAEKIISHLPSIEKIRFVSSGTEATMTAARLARGYTGKEIIIKFAGNYHGHADFFLAKAGSGALYSESASKGVPKVVTESTLVLEYGDTEAIKNIFSNSSYRDKIAAVILEPITGNMGVVVPDKEFHTVLREETEKVGALLIFDEVMTGFRVALNGVQSVYGITPDLTCLAKIIGGGFPAAAFGGKKEIMDFLAPIGPVYQAGTLSGNPVAMEAGYQALCLAEKPGFYEEMERKTKVITEPIHTFFHEEGFSACVQEAGSMFNLFFGKKEVKNQKDALEIDQLLFKEFFCYLFEKGIYIPPLQQEAWFVSSVHTEEHLEKTKEVILEFLKKVLQENILNKQLAKV